MTDHKDNKSKVSKIVIVSRNLTTSGMTFSTQISGVNFTPDTIIVRSMVLACNATAIAAKVYTDLIQGHMAVIAAPANGVGVATPMLRFQSTNGNGNYQFTLQDASGAQIAAAVDNPQIFIQLEFIRH